MSREFSFKLRNDYSSLEELCRKASEFMETNSLSGETSYAADLAVEELVSNVIKYGHDDDAAHEILVRIVIRQALLIVFVEDDGREFDPTSVPSPDTGRPIAERKVGGLGLHLVRSVSEKIRYRRLADRNITEVLIRIKPDPSMQKLEKKTRRGQQLGR